MNKRAILNPPYLSLRQTITMSQLMFIVYANKNILSQQFSKCEVVERKPTYNHCHLLFWVFVIGLDHSLLFISVRNCNGQSL